MSNPNKQIKKAVNEKAAEKESQKVKMRQIIIETDGTNINVVKNQTVGKLELVAILQSVIGFLQRPNQ